MKRGEPLRRRTPLARGLSGLKRTRLRPVSEKQRVRKVAAAAAVEAEGAAFHAAIRGELCVVCGKTAREAYEAGTRHQAHHAVRQEVLNRLGLEALLWAPENAVCVCEEPCHRRHTSRHARILIAALPARVFRFVLEHGLVVELEREYPA